MFLLFGPLVHAGAPAMVTTSSGEVRVDDGSGLESAPPAPFLLPDSHELQLAEDALVVVLYQGSASQIRGPATVATASLRIAAASHGDDESTLLDEILTRRSSTARAGAHRAAEGVKLLRPVPGSLLLAPTEIRWTCATGCGELEVRVYDFLSDEVVWTTRATGATTYAGPALAPGSYSLVVDDRDFLFTVADEAQRTEIETAVKWAEGARAQLAGQGVDDPAALVSVPAAVYFQAGMVTEALYLIDGAATSAPDSGSLKRLREAFELRAGL